MYEYQLWKLFPTFNTFEIDWHFPFFHVIFSRYDFHYYYSLYWKSESQSFCAIYSHWHLNIWIYVLRFVLIFAIFNTWRADVTTGHIQNLSIGWPMWQCATSIQKFTRKDSNSLIVIVFCLSYICSNGSGMRQIDTGYC